MKKKILSSLVICFISVIAFAQLPAFKWKLENVKMISPTSYQFDVILYNTGDKDFELRGGTIAFSVNAAWRNGGKINISTSASELKTAQQKGAAYYNDVFEDYIRKIIPSVSKGAGTIIPFNSKVKCFTVVLTNSVAFSTKSKPSFEWKFDKSPAAGFNCSNAVTTSSTTVVANRGSKEVIANQKYCTVLK